MKKTSDFFERRKVREKKASLLETLELIYGVSLLPSATPLASSRQSRPTQWLLYLLPSHPGKAI